MTTPGHRGLLQKVPWIPFDDLLRVSLVVAGPGVVENRRVSSLVQSFDFVPTVCEVALPTIDTSGMDAVSLWPFLDGEPPIEERWAAYGTGDGWPGVRLGGLKYFRHGPSRQAVLFDLESDPGETTNLLADQTYRDRALELAVGLQLFLDRPPVGV